LDQRGGWRRLHRKEHHNLLFPMCTVIRTEQNKEGGMDETAGRMEDVRFACKVWLGNAEEKRT
jgi:hypothetical protein